MLRCSRLARNSCLSLPGLNICHLELIRNYVLTVAGHVKAGSLEPRHTSITRMGKPPRNFCQVPLACPTQPRPDKIHRPDPSTDSISLGEHHQDFLDENQDACQTPHGKKARD